MSQPTDPLFTVTDKVVVVTGALGQLGRQFVRVLLARGAKVAALDTRPEPLAENAFGLCDSRLLYVQCDITHKNQLEAALACVSQRWGEVHGLVNNAAIDSPPNAPLAETGPFETYPEASWDDVMAVNVKGVMLCCQTFGRAMAATGRGSIINISSIYGLVSPDQRIYEYRKQGDAAFFKPAAYSASKSALLNLTRYLATYWAPHGVRVNSVTFGGVYREQDAQFLRGYCQRVPLGRMAREDEYNGAIVFLLSDAGSYMTGSNMIIDGGWTAW